MSRTIRSFIILILAAWLALGNLAPLPAPAAIPAAPTGLLQFNAGGHIVGLDETGLVIATSTHALRIDFAGARRVQPSSTGRKTGDEGAAPTLDEVTWKDLWPGISLAYRSASSGIAESVYTLQPGAAVADIRLRYNAPVSLGNDGSLITHFDSGEMSESAPLAWQEIDGQRIPVKAAFRVGSGSEVGFSLGRYDPAYPVSIDPVLTWTSFLGGSEDDDRSEAIAVDSNGNVYVVGYSFVPWGAPLRAYSYFYDAYVVKLNSGGSLLWSTFLGGWGNDMAHAVAVDASGNVYVGGESDGTWGSPVRAFNYSDAWVARLDGAGALQWNTFLGANGYESVKGLAVNPAGSVFAVGISSFTWGTPVTPLAGNYEAFTARLTGSTGALVWNTFSGSSAEDHGLAVAATDTTLYISGRSSATWGSPIRSYTGGRDAFIEKINPATGARIWNTFLGGSQDDYGSGLSLDTGGNIYLTGYTGSTWGSPVRAYAGGGDAYAAKVNSSGQLVWNTFLGGSAADTGYGIAVDAYGSAYVVGDSCYVSWGSPVIPMSGNCPSYVAQVNTTSGGLGWNTFLNGSEGGSYSSGTSIAVRGSNIHIAGVSNTGWGTPLRLYSGGTPDGFAAQLSLSGILVWNTFQGSSPDDFILGIDLDDSGNTYVTGYGNMAWGSPVRGYSYRNDAFAAKLDAGGNLVWLTFLGGSGNDYGYAIHRDRAGLVLVGGSSSLSWGTPVRAFGGGASDGFVASLDEDTGALAWNTFLGGAGNESVYAVTIDYTTNIWITGFSNATWGTPIRAYSGGADAMVAKVNFNGVLMWNSFLGGAGNDTGHAITVDNSWHLYVAGNSSAAWGSPYHAYAGGSDAFAAGMTADLGGLAWNTFIGSSGTDTGYGISFDASNYILVAGDTSTGWMMMDDGSTQDGMARPDGGGGGEDAYVTRVNTTNGALMWTTFIGGMNNDYGSSVALGPGGKIYVAGNTVAAWLRPTTDQPDLSETIETLAAQDGLTPANSPALMPEGGGSGTPAFVTELSMLGAITATRFVGGEGSSYASSVVVGDDGFVYLAGYSPRSWGTTVEYYQDGWEGYVTRINMAQFVFLPVLKR